MKRTVANTRLTSGEGLNKQGAYDRILRHSEGDADMTNFRRPPYQVIMSEKLNKLKEERKIKNAGYDSEK